MKKNPIKANQANLMQSLLSKYNPFGFTMPDGQSMEFESVYTAYMCLLIGTWRKYPRGYIELPLFLMTHYRHINYKQAKKMALTMKPLGLDMVVLLGDYSTLRGRETLAKLAKACHTIAGTSFDSYAFNQAYELLQNRIELEKTKKNGTNSH